MSGITDMTPMWLKTSLTSFKRWIFCYVTGELYKNAVYTYGLKSMLHNSFFIKESLCIWIGSAFKFLTLKIKWILISFICVLGFIHEYMTYFLADYWDGYYQCFNYIFLKWSSSSVEDDAKILKEQHFCLQRLYNWEPLIILTYC